MDTYEIVRKSETDLTTTENKQITPPPYQPNNKNKKTTLVLIIGGVLIALGGMGWLIYYILNRDFYITPASVTFESDGGIARFKVDGPSGWEILNTPKAWGSCYREDDYLCYAVGENESFLRKDTIKIGNGRKSARVIITQESGAFYSTPSHSIARNGGETVLFNISGQKEWYVESGPQGWGSTSRDGSILKWTVSENHGSERDDVVVLKAGNKTLSIYITQTAALKAESMSASFSSSGGTKRIKITGPDSWDCRSSEYWIDAEKEGDAVRIECENNDYDSSREGTVTINGGGQTIEIQITQSKKSTSYYNGGWNWWGW